MSRRLRRNVSVAGRQQGRLHGRRLRASLLELGVASLLALGLPAAALAFSFGTQAVLLPRPGAGIVVASKELHLLNRRAIVQAAVSLGRQRVRTLCVQGWTALPRHALPVRNHVVLTSAGWQAAIARWHRLGSQQLLGARRSLIAEMAGCPHLLAIRIARALAAEHLSMRIVQQTGTVENVYRLSLGSFHGTRLYLDMRSRDLRPLAVVTEGRFGLGVGRIRLGALAGDAGLHRLEAALIGARGPRGAS
jgi:hypothetical protein